jgi:hypothetical protein
MTAKHTTVALALAAALTLAGQPALARGAQRGGGHSRGGGHPRPSHAVPRGGGGPHGGGAAQARHPRAGTGGYSHGHYGRYTYYGGHYGYYYPYRSSSYFGAYFGWPYYYSAWWPYGYAGYYYPGYVAPYYAYGYDAPEPPPASDNGRSYAPDRTCAAAVRPDVAGGDTGRIRLEVRPDDASVYVDDGFCGNASEARFLTLPVGRHVIELVRPGFEVVRREVEVARDETSDVLVELQRP